MEQTLVENQTPVHIVRAEIVDGVKKFGVMLDAGFKDVIKGDLFTVSGSREYFRAKEDAKRMDDGWIVTAEPYLDEHEPKSIPGQPGRCGGAA